MYRLLTCSKLASIRHGVMHACVLPQEGKYALPHALVRLRERWADATASSSAEGGWADEEAMVEMEEDLALRGDTIAYRRLGMMRWAPWPWRLL